MKKLKTIFALCTAILLLTSCKKDSGSVVFKNRSVTNRTYNVVWDGSVIASLYPQMDSDTFEVASGKHTCVFKISNTGAEACSQGSPDILSGETQTFTCSQ